VTPIETPVPERLADWDCGGVVGDRNCCRAAAGGRGFERDVDRAIGAAATLDPQLLDWAKSLALTQRLRCW